MKAVVAIDSFKGSLSSMEAGRAAEEGIKRVYPTATVVVKPLADGGEGTTEVLIDGLSGTKEEIIVTGPMGDPVVAYYGTAVRNMMISDSGNDINYEPVSPEGSRRKEDAEPRGERICFMEMACASGITLVRDEERNPLKATTFGLGEMILHAVKDSIKDFIIGIGGSATNDGGLGMLKALGVRFLDRDGNEVWEGANALGQITEIDVSQMAPELSNCRFRVACDVTNPLCGENGATYIYGPQKGISEEQKEPVDKAMRHYGKKVLETFHKDESFMDEPGAGAAGGLGFAFLTFLNAELIPGVSLLLDVTAIEEELRNADIVLTGEGQLDGQTAMGKAPVGVATLAKKHGKKVLAFSGSITEDAKACHEAGIDAYFPIIRGVCSLDEAMNRESAKRNMADAVEEVFRTLRACGLS